MLSSSETTPRRSRAPRIRWLGVAIAALAILAYGNSFSGPFELDDQTAIVENASIRSLWLLGPVLTPPTLAGTGGRPIANLTFALNYALSGTAPWSYHATSVLLHAAIALVLFGLVRRTLQQPAVAPRVRANAVIVAAIAAALWTVHPLATATVDYVSQRTEQLMALFYLLSLYGFARAVNGGGFGWFAFSVSCCAAGMGCKEVMVTAPMMLLLYDRTFVAGSFVAAWRARWRYHVSTAATWGVLAALMVMSHVGARGVGFGGGVSAWMYALTECRALALYLKLAVWPHPLVFDYGWAFVSDAGSIWPHALAIAALLAGTLVALKRRPLVGFAGAWCFVILSPTSSFVPVLHQPIAESRMYLPLAGLAAAAAVTLHAFLRRRAAAIAAAAVVALAVGTVARNSIYREPLTLWSDTLAKQPLNARAHNNLAWALLELKRPVDALPHALEAARLRPTYPEAHVNIGAALAATHRLPEAVEHYRVAATLDPTYAAAHANLGNALLLLGQPAAAQPHLEAALRLAPELAQAHNDLGVLLLDDGRYDEALAHEQAAVRLAPDTANGHYNLGNALAHLQRYPEAIEAYRVALRLMPDFANAHHNLGVVYQATGRPADAVPCFEAALRHNPAHPTARRNLDAARAALGLSP